MFLEISQNSQENICPRVSLLIRLQVEACNIIKKETLALVFSCEFCEISKSTFFTENLLATASNKIFVGPILDYANIIYNKSLTKFFKNKLDMVQCDAALVITVAIKGASRDRIYTELGLEPLAERRWSCKTFFFHKIIIGVLVIVVKEFI